VGTKAFVAMAVEEKRRERKVWGCSSL
jgi:hypothetical protein